MNQREIGETIVKRKLDVMVLSETKLKGTGKCEFCGVSISKSGVEKGLA